MEEKSRPFRFENLRREKNLGQALVHLNFPELNSEFHWVYVNSCPKHAADLFVAPKSVNPTAKMIRSGEPEVVT